MIVESLLRIERSHTATIVRPSDYNAATRKVDEVSFFSMMNFKVCGWIQVWYLQNYLRRTWVGVLCISGVRIWKFCNPIGSKIYS